MRRSRPLCLLAVALVTLTSWTLAACSGDAPDQLLGGSGGGGGWSASGGTGAPSDSGAGADAKAQQGTLDGGHADGAAAKDAADASDARPPVDAGAPDTADPYAAARVLCVKTINDYRATVEAGPLVEWSAAESCTDNRAHADYTANTAHHAFGACGEWAQDECPGWNGTPAEIMVDCLAMMWAEGPGGGHYENMKGPSSRVSCGFYPTPGGQYWATQDFQ